MRHRVVQLYNPLEKEDVAEVRPSLWRCWKRPDEMYGFSCSRNRNDHRGILAPLSLVASVWFSDGFPFVLAQEIGQRMHAQTEVLTMFLQWEY